MQCSAVQLRPRRLPSAPPPFSTHTRAWIPPPRCLSIPRTLCSTSPPSLRSLPERDFDNFQFVNYTKVVRDNPKNPDVAFAIAALQEVPEQFEAIKALKLI